MPILRLICLGLILLGPFSLAYGADADYQRGVEAYNNAEYLKAYSLLLPEAEQGNTNAQFRVGSLLLNGMGMEKDVTLGLRWLKRSAESGDFVAQSYLGSIYSEGNGVAVNIVEAYAWKNIAYRNHPHKISMVELEEIESEMTPDQIEKAKRLAENYYKKFVEPFAK